MENVLKKLGIHTDDIPDLDKTNTNFQDELDVLDYMIFTEELERRSISNYQY